MKGLKILLLFSIIAITATLRSSFQPPGHAKEISAPKTDQVISPAISHVFSGVTETQLTTAYQPAEEIQAQETGPIKEVAIAESSRVTIEIVPDGYRTRNWPNFSDKLIKRLMDKRFAHLPDKA